MSFREHSQTGTQAVAITVGALVYVIAAFLRSEVPRAFEVSLLGHWVASIDASSIYLITLLSGFSAALLYRQFIFVTGFLSGAVGEICHGLIKLLIASHMAGWVLFPISYVADIFINALPSGIGGAAGAAVAVVICDYQKR